MSKAILKPVLTLFGDIASMPRASKPCEDFSFTLTEAERRCLSFAVLCEVESLETCYEAHKRDVKAAIKHLWKIRNMLEGFPQGRPA